MARRRTSRTRPAASTLQPKPAPVPESLTSKGFRVRGFGPLPEGFNPMTASPRQLAVHRLPPRPDAEREPQLRALWDRAMSRTRVWIVPEFVHREHIHHGPARKIVPARPSGPIGRGVEFAAAPKISNATSSNWSGAAVFSPSSKPYTYVGGQWTVPSANSLSGGFYYASEWVGIDGWGSSDVMQAGTETEIINFWPFFTSRVVYTWWEWFPAGEVAISNLPVASGDVMYCLICADTMSSATVYFSNLSTGVATRFDITAPRGTTLAGNVAEWIVERPTVGGSVANLTDYGVCYFDECVAGGNGGIDSLSSATLITMTGSGGSTLSYPVKENADLVKLNWVKSS